MDKVVSIVVISLILIILLSFLIIRNSKDEIKFEDELKNDYYKSRDRDKDNSDEGDLTY